MRVSLAWVVGVGVVCALLAASFTYALVRGDGGTTLPPHRAAAPVALTGVLREASGKPVANAHVQLMAADYQGAKVGQEIPIVGLASARTGSAGRFTVRQAMSAPIIRKLAAKNGGWVNFDVYIDAHGQFMPWAVPRKIDHRRWVADEDKTPASFKRETITFKALR